MEQLPRVLSRFGEAYDDPDAVAIRGYASGLATSAADVSWLSGADGYLMKPFNVNGLRDKIEDVLSLQAVTAAG